MGAPDPGLVPLRGYGPGLHALDPSGPKRRRAGRPFGHHPQVLVIRFEALLTDWRRVCRFVGVDFPALLDDPESARIQVFRAL